MELRYLFTPYGEITSCRILCQGDSTGEGGAAMVRLGTTEQAVQAVQGLRGHRIRGSLHPLIVRFADTAEVKARKQARQMQMQGGSAAMSDNGSSQLGGPAASSQVLHPDYNPFARLAEMPPAFNPGLLPVAANSTQCVSSLYVANLPPDTSKLFLYEMFSPFGAILSVKVRSLVGRNNALTLWHLAPT